MAAMRGRRMMARQAAVMLAALVLCGPALADDEEPVGQWRYRKDDRPVKVIVIGGSIAAWAKGNFGHFLGHVCERTEIKNRAKTGYGAWALKKRFQAQFLKNWSVKLKDERFEYWLMYAGGLNSIGMPEMTIHHTMKTFLAAHRHEVKVVALSLTPWGDSAAKRWKGWGGLDYLEKTRKVVDYVLGRLERNAALRRYAGKAPEQTQWGPGELPDIAIDLYDSKLRDTAAEFRETERWAKEYDRKRALQKRWPDREQALKALTEVPRWFMRKEYRSFDHIHPNRQGHRLIAQTACPRLPANWGCECARLANLRWEDGKVIEAPATPDP